MGFEAVDILDDLHYAERVIRDSKIKDYCRPSCATCDPEICGCPCHE